MSLMSVASNTLVLYKLVRWALKWTRQRGDTWGVQGIGKAVKNLLSAYTLSSVVLLDRKYKDLVSYTDAIVSAIVSVVQLNVEHYVDKPIPGSPSNRITVISIASDKPREFYKYCSVRGNHFKAKISRRFLRVFLKRLKTHKDNQRAAHF